MANGPGSRDHGGWGGEVGGISAIHTYTFVCESRADWPAQAMLYTQSPKAKNVLGPLGMLNYLRRAVRAGCGGTCL